VCDLLDSDEYACCRMASRRNVRRLLAHAAGALGLQVACEDDQMAALEQNRAAPDLAHCSSITEYNRMSATCASGRDVVAYYSHAASLRECRDTVAQLVDPIYGMIVYRGSEDARGDDGRGPFGNGCSDAFPISTGRHTAEEMTTARAAIKSDAKRLAYADRVVTWRGKQRGTAASNDRIFRYADMTDRRIDIRAQALGAVHGHSRLKPVLTLIPPPDAAPAAQ